MSNRAVAHPRRCMRALAVTMCLLLAVNVAYHCVWRRHDSSGVAGAIYNNHYNGRWNAAGIPADTGTVTEDKYLLVHSIREGLNGAKGGLRDLMYLAKESGRILVEPSVVRTNYAKATRQLGFGYDEDAASQSSFRDYYDVDAIQRRIGVTVITFDEYTARLQQRSQQLDIGGGGDTTSSTTAIEVRFSIPRPWMLEDAQFVCRNTSVQPFDPRAARYTRGMFQRLAGVDGRMMRHLRVKCVDLPSDTAPALGEALVRYMLLPSPDSPVDYHTVIISNFVGHSKYLLPVAGAQDPDEWRYVDRLHDKVARIVEGSRSGDGSALPAYAAFHFRVLKLFLTKSPQASEFCAGVVLDTVQRLLEASGISTLYVASDLLEPEDRGNPVLRPYLDTIGALRQQYTFIDAGDRADIDRDFVDQLLCIRADLFLYTYGASEPRTVQMDATNATETYQCTSTLSYFTEFITKNRRADRRIQVNLSRFL